VRSCHCGNNKQVSSLDSLLRSKYRELVCEGGSLMEQRLVSPSHDLACFFRHVNRKIANSSSICTITVGCWCGCRESYAFNFNNYFWVVSSVPAIVRVYLTH